MLLKKAVNIVCQTMVSLFPKCGKSMGGDFQPVNYYVPCQLTCPGDQYTLSQNLLTILTDPMGGLVILGISLLGSRSPNNFATHPFLFKNVLHGCLKTYLS